jgi:hypothetical protein
MTVLLRHRHQAVSEFAGTSVDETERQKIQRLLTEEKSKAESQALEPREEQKE